MKFYEPFKNVQPIKSNSSYGNWVVKTDEVTFRFFWRFKDARDFAYEHNRAVMENQHESE